MDTSSAAERTAVAGRILAVIAWLLLAVMALFFVVRASTNTYTPDSWSYVDIARSFYEQGRSIGDVQIARQYVGVPWVNNSFPLLWPFLLSLPMRFTGPTAPVGAMYFAPVLLLTALTLLGIMRTLGKPRLLAPLAALAMLAIPGYAGEGSGGRTIPLTVLLLLVSLLSLLRFRVTSRWIWLASCGLAAGLAAATRFDAAAVGPVLALLALWIGWIGIRQLLVLGAFWFLGPFTWVVYSLLRLGVVYGSDNSHVVMDPRQSGAGWWPLPFPGTPLDRLMGVLARWAGNVSPTVLNLLQTFAVLLFVAAFSAALAALLLAVPRRRLPTLASEPERGQLVRESRLLILGLLLALIVVEIVMMATTAYFEDRYWAAVAALAILGMCLVFGAVRPAGLGNWANASIATFLVLAGFLGLMTTSSGYTFNRDATVDDAALVGCLRAADGTGMVRDLRVFRIGATTDLRVAYMPNNAYKMTEQDWQQVFDDFGIDRWVVTKDTKEFVIPTPANGLLQPVDCPT